jgi:hypothetical protein
MPRKWQSRPGLIKVPLSAPIWQIQAGESVLIQPTLALSADLRSRHHTWSTSPYSVRALESLHG